MTGDGRWHDDNVPAARRLRKPLERGEAVLWERLRGRRFEGLKFRRQHPIGRFVVDFYCAELRFAVELDGGVHSAAEVSERDRWRQSLIEEHNVRFARINHGPNGPDLEAALGMIAEAVDTISLSRIGRGPG